MGCFSKGKMSFNFFFVCVQKFISYLVDSVCIAEREWFINIYEHHIVVSFQPQWPIFSFLYLTIILIYNLFILMIYEFLFLRWTGGLKMADMLSVLRCKSWSWEVRLTVVLSCMLVKRRVWGVVQQQTLCREMSATMLYNIFFRNFVSENEKNSTEKYDNMDWGSKNTKLLN